MFARIVFYMEFFVRPKIGHLHRGNMYYGFFCPHGSRIDRSGKNDARAHFPQLATIVVVVVVIVVVVVVVVIVVVGGGLVEYNLRNLGLAKILKNVLFDIML